MNDFTKEELQNIYDFMKPPLWFYESKNCTLITKLQSMIDNYCEQEICRSIQEDEKALADNNIYFEGTVE